MLPTVQQRRNSQVGLRGSGSTLHEERARKTAARERSAAISEKRIKDAEPVTIDWETFTVPHTITHVRGPSGHMYRGKACFQWPGSHPRRCAIYLVEAWWFDSLILITILCNCFTMALESPLDSPGTWRAAVIEDAEIVFILLFSVELVLKVQAYGLLWHKGAYLRDPWCQLDFLVVSLAWAPVIFPDFGNYSEIRMLRAFRPLRALKRVPGMPALVQSILATVPKLGELMLQLINPTRTTAAPTTKPHHTPPNPTPQHSVSTHPPPANSIHALTPHHTTHHTTKPQQISRSPPHLHTTLSLRPILPPPSLIRSRSRSWAYLWDPAHLRNHWRGLLQGLTTLPLCDSWL